MSSNLVAKTNYDLIVNLKDEEKIINHIVGFCLYSGDYELSIKLCRYFMNDKNLNIQASVIHGIGYIGMNFKKIDEDLVQKIFSMYSHSTDRIVKCALEDAKDDLSFLVKK